MERITRHDAHYARTLEPGAHGLPKWPEYTRHSGNVNTLTFHFHPHNFMKYATFSLASDVVPRLGVVHGDCMLDASTLSAGNWRPPTSLLELIQQGPESWQRMRELVAQYDPGGDFRADARTSPPGSFPLSDIRWHAPIPRPIKNVFCLGRNYVAHAEEAARVRGQEVKIPTVPVIFTKASTSARRSGVVTFATSLWSGASTT